MYNGICNLRFVLHQGEVEAASGVGSRFESSNIITPASAHLPRYLQASSPLLCYASYLPEPSFLLLSSAVLRTVCWMWSLLTRRTVWSLAMGRVWGHKHTCQPAALLSKPHRGKQGHLMGCRKIEYIYAAPTSDVVEGYLMSCAWVHNAVSVKKAGWIWPHFLKMIRKCTVRVCTLSLSLLTFLYSKFP